ncbi:MAG: ribosome rescue protein RqcH [Acidilobus sp.]
MARKSMSALDLLAWVSTSGAALVGQRVDNVYQEGQAVALRVRGRYGEFLVIEPSVRIHMSSRYRPSGPPEGGIGRALRDLVRDSRISGVRQVGFDRLVEISFDNGYRLVAELLPRGVLALVSPDGKLVSSTAYLTVKDRTLRRGQPYSYPPLRLEDPFLLPSSRLLEAVRASRAQDLVRALVLTLGIPGEAAEEAIRRSGVEAGLRPTDLDEPRADRLSEALRSIREESLAGRGFLVKGDAGPVEADPFRPTAPGLNVIEFGAFDEALDELFASRPQAQAEQAVEAERQRLLASLERARKEAEEYATMASDLEAAANALAAHYHEVEEAIRCLRAGCEGVPPIVKGFDRRSGDVVLLLDGREVKLKVYEEVEEAVKRLYREAGELRAKSRRASSAEAEVKERLARLEEEARVRRLADAVRRRKRSWYERYHWLVTSSGLLAIGGRDADQNESIVRRFLGDSDLFLHADIHGAPAVVLFTGGQVPQEADIAEAAVITAAYSRAWKEEMGSVSVYWALGSQVSKSPPAGEYLTKGAFMVYGKKNYLPPLRVELYIGVALDEDGLPVVVVGPEGVVSAQSLAYVRVVPGDERVDELASHVLELIASRSPDPDLVRALGPSEVAFRLPGRGRVTGAWKGGAGGLRRPRTGPSGA